MYYASWFWLLCLVTIAVIFFYLLVFRERAGGAAGKYDVFLSFSDVDTRKGFADYLYQDLVDAGIRTFRCKDEIRKGEDIGPELIQAIEDSKISIVIFSKNYASNKWCLSELDQMVECQTNLGQKIFPIFYDVDRSDVLQQRGCYEEAFRRHQNHFSEMTVHKWKESLEKVGALMQGWDLKKVTNGHQGKLVKMVVSKVLLELKKTYMVENNELVGIDRHIKEMMRLLNVDSNDVRIVGIFGTSGIGKTTIAKVIYDQLFENFECCFFLPNVQETSQQLNGLVNLKNELFSKIRGGKCLDVANIDEGIKMIEDTVYRKKALIVVDNVDKESPFIKLVDKRDCFALGSRIIVTTRNEEVLHVLKMDGTYKPPLMGLDHSLQLLSKHAFLRDFPPKDYYILSRKIVSTVVGLPLALEIIGSLLFGQRKFVWEDTLKKLKEIPDDNVWKKLRISYGALNNEQKQIFLDIACLFIGEDKCYHFYMWDACKFYPVNGIDVLVLRSLVKVGDDNILRMHDELRDLGREIVREENFQEPGERSRLWLHGEALDTLKRHMGTKKVEALKTLGFELEPHTLFLTSDLFGQLQNLRFLQIDHANLAGDFKHLLTELRWLNWRGCLGSSAPTNFHLKNLVVLNLSGSKMTDDWEAWSQIKMAKKLKVLDLSYCTGLSRTPDFSTFVTLERLILRWCQNLVQIDQSIGNLLNLRVLDIAYSGVTKLPYAIGNLTELEEINVSHCFDMKGEIPSNIGRLSSLRILRLDSTKIYSLPIGICGLCCLQTLDLLKCAELQSLPVLPPSLTGLRITCEFMKTFPGLSNLINLKELFFYDCLNLVEITRDIGKLSKLEIFVLSTTNIRTLPAGIGVLSRLKQIKVEFCKNLQCVLGIPSSLFELCVSNCASMERLPDLSNLKNLSELIIVQCCKLMDIQGLEKLRLLTSLDVAMCENLSNLDGLEQLESLRYLNTSGCQSLERLPDLSNLKKLQKLVAMDCEKLIKIQGVDRLKSLEHFNIDRCKSIEELPDLSDLGRLKVLSLFECQKLVMVEGLGVLKSLEVLDVSWCISLERLPDLSNLKNLKELKIRGWKNLAEIPGLEELYSLELLDIVGCKFPSLDFSNLKKLKKLVACQGEKLNEIRGREELKSLTLLYVSGCDSIEKLADLSTTKILRPSWEASY